jgi:hypothetical protein
MIKKQSTAKGGTKGKGRGSKGKQTAAQLRDADELTASRVRAILADPKTPSRVAGKLQSLVNKLGELTDAPAPDTADFYADTFLLAAETVRGGMPNTPDERAEAAPVYADVALYAERHEPEGYRLARCVSEIYVEAKRRGDREDYILQAADEVTTGGGERVMLSSPASKFFAEFFAEAMRDMGDGHRALVALKGIVARCDAGVTLREQAEEAETRGRERAEQRKAEQLAKPEPKDKTRDAWRIWKLRQIEADFRSDDQERYSAAWATFRRFLHDFDRDNRATVNRALALLPTLLIGYQNEVKEQTRGKRSEAARRGAQARRASAAKKGGRK